MNKAALKKRAENRPLLPIEGVEEYFIKELTLEELQGFAQIEGTLPMNTFIFQKMVCDVDGIFLLDADETFEMLAPSITPMDLDKIGVAVEAVMNPAKKKNMT